MYARDFGELGRSFLILTMLLTLTLVSSCKKSSESVTSEKRAVPEPRQPEPTGQKVRRLMNRNFIENLPQDFYLPDDDDDLGIRILQDYGAILVGKGSLKPSRYMFANEDEVRKFQNAAGFAEANIGGIKIDLQPAAMEALLSARAEARQQGLDITPRGGADAARRSYEDTLRLWDTRFLPALNYWYKRGRLSREQIASLRQLPIKEQVAQVLELEKKGIYFSKDLSKSILYSIAAPGTSQHISMLALDVSQFSDARVRRIMARHGWFQTVYSDLPHFTYLGLEENDLPSRGLRPVKSGSQLFWIPATGN
jgi:hypothetical protein